MKAQFDRRLIPAMAILLIGVTMLILSICAGFYLNLDHQASGFEYAYPKFKEAHKLSLPLLGEHSQAWFLALVVDMLMGGAEVLSVGFNLLLNRWQGKLDDLDHIKVPDTDPRRRKLDRWIDLASDARKHSFLVFIVAGLISVAMVCTAFVTGVQGDAWGPLLLSAGVGCLTPFLIAASAYIFLTALQVGIGLVFEEEVLIPEAEQDKQKAKAETAREATPERKDQPAQSAGAPPKPQGNGGGHPQGGKHHPKGQGQQHGGSSRPPQGQGAKK